MIDLFQEDEPPVVTKKSLHEQGESDALRMMHHVQTGTIIHYDKSLKMRHTPRNVIELTEALGNMVFTHKGEYDAIGIKYAIDFSKDISVRKGVDYNYVLAYALAFLEYVDHVHQDEEHVLGPIKPGVYKLQTIMNDYTNAFVKVILDVYKK